MNWKSHSVPKQITPCTLEDWDWVTATSPPPTPPPDGGRCILLHVPPVEWEGCPSLGRPSSRNAHPTLTGSLPTGRQCHHSAASSSARLNTGAKVQTAAGLGEVCAHTHIHFGKRGEKKHAMSHVHVSLFNTKSLHFTLAHTESSCSKTVAMGQRSHWHGAELVPWWWLVRQHNSNFISPGVTTLWTGRLCSPPTPVIHVHEPLYCCEVLDMCVDGEEVKNHGCGVRRGVSFYEQDLEFLDLSVQTRLIQGYSSWQSPSLFPDSRLTMQMCFNETVP